MGRLDGKVAIVTGGAMGIGAAPRLRCSRGKGASVVLADVDEDAGARPSREAIVAEPAARRPS